METVLQKKSCWMILGILLLVTFLTYGNCFQNDWTYDDIPVVIGNPDIRSLDAFQQDSYSGRPLRELSYMVDYAVFGDDPAGYHLQQNLWHAANGFLLYLLFIALGIRPLFALLGTVLFLVHPLQVESVANIGHRKELLPLFFALTSIHAYIRGMAAEKTRRIFWFFLCLGAYFLAVLSNVTASLFPLLFVLYELLYLEKGKRFLARNMAALALVGVGLSAFALYYYFNHMNFRTALLTFYSQNGFAETKAYYPLFFGALTALSLYASKILAPVNLAPEYTVNLSADYWQWQAVPGLLILLGLVAAFFILLRRRSIYAFAIAWFFAFYPPVSNFLPVNAYVMADRYMYMVLPGVSLAVAFFLQRTGNRKAVGGAVVLLICLTVMTIFQNRVWRDDYSLWTHAVSVNSNSSGANWSAGRTFVERGELDRALFHMEKVLEINPFFVPAYLELGKIHERKGEMEKAVDYYRKYVRYAQQTFPAQARNVKRYLGFLESKSK